MRFLLAISKIFLISLLLIFTLAACGDGNKDTGEESSDNSTSSENRPSSIVTGATDNDEEFNVSDIFGNDSSSSGTSSESGSSASSGSSSSGSSDSGNGSQSSSSSGSSSSGINYEDPSVWTDPV